MARRLAWACFADVSSDSYRSAEPGSHWYQGLSLVKEETRLLGLVSTFSLYYRELTYLVEKD